MVLLSLCNLNHCVHVRTEECHHAHLAPVVNPSPSNAGFIRMRDSYFHHVIIRVVMFYFQPGVIINPSVFCETHVILTCCNVTSSLFILFSPDPYLLFSFDVSNNDCHPIHL